MTYDATESPALRGRDLSRLPKWAQDEIERLQRDLGYAQAKLAEGLEDSDTFADPYGAVMRSLGSGPLIRFGGEGHEGTFDARWHEGALHIHGNAGMRGEMVILPQVSNSITLAIREG
jgi:hypothetical protein